MKTKLVFFGNQKLATGIAVEPIVQSALASAGYDIEAVVTEKPPTKFDSQLAVLAAHGRILPQGLLNQFPLGIINIHPSLLPHHRGSTPIEQTILDGDDKTGVSIMRLTNEMDAGPLFIQKQIKLTGSESKAGLALVLQTLGAELLVAVLPEILEGKQPYVQHHPDRATCTKLINKSDGAIDWHKSAERLEREVRAYAGWPGSFTNLNGRDLIITQAYVENIRGPVGQTFKHNRSLGVHTGSGSLIIDRLKPAGKREMFASEWLAGNSIA